MMRNKIVLCLGFIILAYSCQKFEIEEGTPKCVEQLIKEFSSETDCVLEVDVRRYRFQGENVYLFRAGDCDADIGSEIFDGECNSLGFLGGVNGNMIINGEDFSVAVLISVVWTKQA